MGLVVMVITVAISNGTPANFPTNLRITSSSPKEIISDNTPTLKINTTINAKCKYSTSAFDFDTEGILMSGEGTTTHSYALGTLTDDITSNFKELSLLAFIIPKEKSTSISFICSKYPLNVQSTLDIS